MLNAIMTVPLMYSIMTTGRAIATSISHTTALKELTAMYLNLCVKTRIALIRAGDPSGAGPKPMRR